jgi:hypothetical protein
MLPPLDFDLDASVPPAELRMGRLEDTYIIVICLPLESPLVTHGKGASQGFSGGRALGTHPIYGYSAIVKKGLALERQTNSPSLVPTAEGPSGV